MRRACRPFIFCLHVHIGYAIYTDMHTHASFDDRAKTRWLCDVTRLWPVAKGSLSEVRKPCTRPNCPACRDGRRHKVFLFCYREDGRSRCAYVPAAAVALVRQAIANQTILSVFSMHSCTLKSSGSSLP